MDDINNINYKLLANPFHHRQKKEKISVDDELFSLLNKKFPGLSIFEKDHSSLLKKIDFILVEASISNIVNDTVEDIIKSIDYE